MPSQYVSMKDISPMHTKRSIRVRLVRTYEVPEVRGAQISKSKECLFHDVEESYIHATIYKDDVLKYKNIFQEGKLYSIKNFLVVSNYYMYKTNEHRFLIKFNYKTEVKEIRSKGFPVFMFRLRTYESLKDPTKVNEKELFDVIGRVVEIYAPLDKIIGGKPSRLIDFLIADNEKNTLKCTVWDEHVSAMLPFYNADLNEPLIVVIQLCRAKIVNGEVRITSLYDATKLHFNSSFAEFSDFKSKLSAGYSPVRSISTATVLSQSTGIGDFKSGSVVVSSISDLLDQKEDVDLYVPAEILGIEGSGRWYYISCMSAGCNKKLQEDETFMICSKCEKKYAHGTVRYKVVVRVLDKTGDAPFLLWDREVAELVGIPASVLYDKYKKETEIPPELESLIGMAMIFKISVKKEHFRGLTSAFTVMRVLRDEVLVSTYCHKFKDEQEKDLMSKMLEEDEEEDEESYMEASQGDEVNSPGSTQDLRNKAVDIQDSDTAKRCLLDQFSSSNKMKKSKLAHIKQEKM